MLSAALLWLDKYAHDIAIGLGLIACVIIMVQTGRLENAKRDLREARLQLSILNDRADAANKAAAALDRGEVKVSADASASQQKVQTVIKWRTQTLVKEVPNVVTEKVDADFRIPYGPLRLWNDQVRAEQLADVPDAAGQPDDTAADTAWSALTPWGLETLAAGQACRAELAGLQGWVRDQAQLWSEAPH